MSICVYGRIKGKCMDDDLLEGTLVEFFKPKNFFIRKNNGKHAIRDDVGNEDVITISFISEKKSPYNVYDSNIINGEFEYAQLVLFDIRKEKASVDRYKEIINFYICLRKKINSDILVTSDVHDDICLLKEKEIIWSKNLSFDYSLSTQ